MVIVGIAGGSGVIVFGIYVGAYDTELDEISFVSLAFLGLPSFLVGLLTLSISKITVFSTGRNLLDLVPGLMDMSTKDL